MNKLKVTELKEMLKARGLKVSGRKSELIERIQEFDKAVANYNETSDIVNKKGAMFDYIKKNMTDEISFATGGLFVETRIDDAVGYKKDSDIINWMVEDASGMLDFYIDGGNEQTPSETRDVKNFYEFLKNLSRHTDVNPV